MTKIIDDQNTTTSKVSKNNNRQQFRRALIKDALGQSGEKRFLSTKEVCQRYGFNQGTMGNWAWKRTGPKFYLVGRKRFYDPVDIEAFIRQYPVCTIDQHD